MGMRQSVKTNAVRALLRSLIAHARKAANAASALPVSFGLICTNGVVQDVHAHERYTSGCMICNAPTSERQLSGPAVSW